MTGYSRQKFGRAFHICIFNEEYQTAGTNTYIIKQTAADGRLSDFRLPNEFYGPQLHFKTLWIKIGDALFEIMKIGVSATNKKFCDSSDFDKIFVRYIH